MNRIVTFLLLGAALLLAGAMSACGGSDASESAASAPAAAAATSTPTPKSTDWPDGSTAKKKSKDAKPSSSGGGGAAAGKAVEIENFAFGPKDVSVKVGQKITWTNQDDAPHTVTAQSGGSVDSGTLAKGASFSFTPDKAGTISYICAIHPNMTATITVQ